MTSRTGSTASVETAELVDLLTVTQRALARDLAGALEEEGATLDQWRILRALDTEEGRPMGELAACLEIASPTLTRLVDGLADSAHLYRTQSSQDRRKISVHLSDRGRSLLSRLDALAVAHEAAIATRLGDETVGKLIHSLRQARDCAT